MAEVAADGVLVSPVDKSAEVLQPLAEAIVLRLRAKHRVGNIGAIEDAGVVWAYVVAEVAELPLAAVAGCGGNGKDGGGGDALEDVFFCELGIANEFCSPDCIVHLTPLLLGNDNPCGVEGWVWDDVGIYGCELRCEGDGEVFLRRVC